MLANFGKYFRFIIRRERIISLIWIAAIVICTLGFASVYPGMLPDEQALQGYAAMLDMPTTSAIMGKGYGAQVLNPAIVMTHECSIWFSLTFIIMNIFFVNRHTCKDEELGRLEMLAALPVGKLSGSFSVLISSFILNATVSLLSAFGLLAMNIEGTTTAGAFAYTFSFGVQGFLFAAVTLLTAQLFSTARGSSGAAFAVMGIAYIMRAYGDMTDSVWSYISPLGLGLKPQPFYKDDFGPLIIILVEAIAVAAVALLVNAKRDVGTGIFPARKGHEHASLFLQSKFGFAWRMVKNPFFAWGATVFLISMMYGSILGQFDNFLKTNKMMRQMLTVQGNSANSAAESFLPMLCGLTAMIIAIPVITTITKLYSEEKRGRMEQVYALAVPRLFMLLPFSAIAVIEAVLFTFLSAVGLYAASENTGLVSFETFMKSSFVYLPALLLIAGFAVFLVGVLPKFTALAWVVPVYGFAVMFFGALFKIPDFAMKLSPFAFSPQLPVEEFRAMPLVLLTVIAVVIGAVGFWRYRQRDIG